MSQPTSHSILVIGSLNMDLVLSMERAPCEGENLLGREYRYVPGGKGGNQAVAVARMGGRATLVACVGVDTHGRALKERLIGEGISSEQVIVRDEQPTGLAVILLETNGANRIVVYPGANMLLKADDVESALARGGYDAVMVQLETADEVVQAAVRGALSRGIPVVLDAGPARAFDLSTIRGVTILTPNESEAALLSGMPCGTLDECAAAARALAVQSGARFVVVKLGARGALLYDGCSATHVPPFAVQAIDTTAAGDAFTAAMTLAWLCDGDMRRAISYGAAAGALATTRLGAQPSLPTADEVAQFLLANRRVDQDS